MFCTRITLARSASSAPNSSRRIAWRTIVVPRRRNRSSSGATSCREAQVERQQVQPAHELHGAGEDPGLDQPARRGGEQEDADHPAAEQLRALAGERHHAHAAHGVAGQHHRPGGGDRVEDLAQVAPGAVDRGVGQPRPPGPPVAALVPEHQPGPAAQGGALDLPLGEARGEPVGEDDGDRCVLGAVELHVQRDAVVGDHRAGSRRWGTGRARQGRRRVDRHPASVTTGRGRSRQGP
jgi:hypothetical protein